MSDEYDDGFDDFLGAIAHQCHYCDICSPSVCGGVMQGGFCDSMCWCGPEDDYPENIDDDEEWDAP